MRLQCGFSLILKGIIFVKPFFGSLKESNKKVAVFRTGKTYIATGNECFTFKIIQ